MAFGKRPVSAAKTQPPSEAPHGRRRVIPAEMWEGEMGGFLRELGLDPNDASNLIHNQSSVEERLAHGRAQVDAKAARMMADLPIKDGKLRPFFLLPDPCWNGELGHFLMMRLELFPYDDWNVAYLAADERTALVLDIPAHPNGNIPAFVQAAEKFLRDAEAHLRRAHEETTVTQDFAKFADTVEEIRGRVKALAHHFVAQLDKAWKAQNAAAGRA
ncbi:MAG: hypothetical protein AB7G05_07665 [Hyphomonadaceae bacterium]